MEFVDFDLAKKLKEKGFKNNCIGYYDYAGEFHYNYESAISNKETFFFIINMIMYGIET